MNDKIDIDELLTGFVDGQLSQRQQTEVKRLIKHDQQIAEKLRRIQKCKILVGSLPAAEAPSEMLEDIQYKLERRTLLQEQPEDFERAEGAKHLFIRKAVSVAAIIALAAVLVTIVYTIVAPEPAPHKPVAFERLQDTDVKAAVAEPVEKPVAKAAVDKRFSGRLELTTNEFDAVNAFIARAIVDNGLLQYTVPKSESQKGIYSVGCSREALNMFLSDMQSIWNRFDSTVLLVEPDNAADAVVVRGVTARQIVEISRQDNLEDSLRVSKDFAVLNSMTERLPGDDVLAAIETGKADWVSIPKPVLTSNDKNIKKLADTVEKEKLLDLTIVVTARE